MLKRSQIFTFMMMLTGQTVDAEPLPQFSGNMPWNRIITTAPAHPDSETMIASLSGLGGFGLGRMQIDFSLHVVRGELSDPLFQLTERANYYEPDCDDATGMLPIPTTAAIEGYTDLNCVADGDCHLLLLRDRFLYEFYRAHETSPGTLTSQCLAIWDLDATYPPEGRGEHCTSADAAGFPIAPLLFNADEIAESLDALPDGSGDIGHAIRFILPNDRMASDASLGGVAGRLYVRPASHAGGPSGPVKSVPYGARLRLQPEFPVHEYPPAVRVILHTLQRYGMVLADGGNVALTAESDLYTDTSWTALGIDSRIFDQTPGATPVQISDFDVLDTGPRIAETYECIRTELPPDLIYNDSFGT